MAAALDRIGPHVQRGSVLGTDNKEFLRRWLAVAPVMLAIDEPDILAQSHPDAVKIFRHVWPQDKPPMDPKQEVDEIIHHLGGYTDDRLYLLLCGNEQNEDADFERWAAAAAYAHERGYKVAGPNRATGTYEDSFVEAFRNYKVNGKPFCGFDATAWHAYWADHGFTPWNALRPFTQYRAGDPLLLITEFGRDRVRDGDPNVNGGWTGEPGWKLTGLTGDQYISELRDYNAQLKRGPWLGVVFGVGHLPQWDAFEVDSLLWKISQLAGTQPMSLEGVKPSMGFQIGPGIVAEMQKYGDTPQSDEVWYAADFSSALGKLRRYWYYKDGNVVVSAPKAH